MKRCMGALGAGLICAGAVGLYGGVAGASFPGSNGWIAYSSTRANVVGDTTLGNIWAVNPATVAAGGTPTAATDPGASHELTATSADDQGPAFSPDGSQVVFFSDRSANGEDQIWKVAATNVPVAEDTTGASPGADGAVQVTSEAAEDTWPSFSPDGHTIAYVASSTSGTGSQIKLLDTTAPGAVAVVVVSSPGGIALNRPVFDPVNASMLVYTSSVGHMILVSNLDTPSQSTVDLSAATGIGAQQADEYPDWSPDGTTIIFDSNRVVGTSGGQKQLFTLNVAAASAGTSTASPVFQASGTGVATGHSDFQPVFSPDGKQIAFSRSESGNDVDSYMLNTGGKDTASPTGGLDLTLAPHNPSDTQPNWQGVQTTPPVLPESPALVALPALGALVVGGTVVVGRRRRRVGT